MSTDPKKERDTIKGPEVKTIKRLVAVSDNRCAFTGCKTPLVDTSGKVTGRTSHIKATSPGLGGMIRHKRAPSVMGSRTFFSSGAEPTRVDCFREERVQ